MQKKRHQQEMEQARTEAAQEALAERYKEDFFGKFKRAMTND